jgi:uncharacterized membrane protein YfcA
VTIYTLTTLIGFGAFGAGLLGALTGLGGGIIIVPLLTLVFGIDIRYAIGASLVSVIATSSGAAAAYVREGYTNIRVGMLLEIGTTVGAIFGAYLAGWIPTNVIAIIFALVLLFAAYRQIRPEHATIDPTTPPDPLAVKLRLNSTYPTPTGPQPYTVHSVKAGLSLMSIAGALSGLLGVGSGTLKVLAMDQAMRLPFKVSTTTSNFMIGVTAAASAGIYLHRGYILPSIAFPVMLGVLLGATLGARTLTRTNATVLRQIFTAVIVVVAIELLYKGMKGAI